MQCSAVSSPPPMTTSRFEKFGDIEVSFGVVEPTKVIKNGGDWSIAWNRTVRAIVFAFPHHHQELTRYGEYIINLFSVTHPTVHTQVIAFNRAVRKRIGSVQNLELSEFEKFANLKIVHMDSIRVAVNSGPSKGDNGKGAKHGKNWKKDEPCNKWNDGKCNKEEEDCQRQHICNKCRKAGHRGKQYFTLPHVVRADSEDSLSCPSGLQGQSELSEWTPRTVQGQSEQSKDSPSSPSKV